MGVIDRGRRSCAISIPTEPHDTVRCTVPILEVRGFRGLIDGTRVLYLPYGTHSNKVVRRLMSAM